MKCPTFERLIDFLDERLASSSAAAVVAHLDTGCSHCASDRAWYESLKRVAASDDSVEPPPWVLKRALKVFEEPGRTRTTVASRAGRLIASLLFDSLSQPAVAEARSVGADGRQLLYRAGDYSIDLQVTPAGQNRSNLAGQILREGEFSFESVAALPLQLSGASGSRYSIVTSDRGEFSVSSLELGTYELRIDAQGSWLTIEGLVVP
ncbi:MAG: carboxypeptidase-like regulatory domain-containing protein [Acidobacteriota bacterium]